MRRTRNLSRIGTVGIEQLAVLAGIAALGVAAFGALGSSMAKSIADNGPADGAHGRTSSADYPSTAAITAQAGLVGAMDEAAEATRAARRSTPLTAMERADLRRSPVGRHLQLSADPDWRRATEFYFADRITNGRPYGEGITRPFESFLGKRERADALRINEPTREALRTSQTAPAGAIRSHVTDERLSRLVEDPVLDILARHGGTVRRSEDASDVPFALKGRELVLYEGHPLFSGVRDELTGLDARGDAAVDQIYERFALHLLELDGAPPRSAVALSRWLRSTESLRARATRRLGVHAKEQKLAEAFSSAKRDIGALEEHLIELVSRRSPAVREDLAGVRERLAARMKVPPAVDAQLTAVNAGLERLDAGVRALLADEQTAAKTFEAARLDADSGSSFDALSARMLAVADEADALRESLGHRSTRDGTPVLRTRAPKQPETPEVSEAARRADAFLERLGD